MPWPSVHAPWYGYLFWTIAAAGKYNSKSDATFVNTKVEDKGKCGANMKVGCCCVAARLTALPQGSGCRGCTQSKERSSVPAASTASLQRHASSFIPTSIPIVLLLFTRCSAPHQTTKACLFCLAQVLLLTWRDACRCGRCTPSASPSKPESQKYETAVLLLGRLQQAVSTIRPWFTWQAASLSDHPLLLLLPPLLPPLLLLLQVWALRADNGDLRIALINKDDAINCNMKLWIDDKRFCRTASISKLLPGQAGIKSKGNITWQGQTYENAGFTGKIQGSTVVMQIESKQYPKVGKCGFEVPVPASSAALLVAKKATK